MLAFIVFLSTGMATAQFRQITVSSTEELERIFSAPVDSIRVNLNPGIYTLHPKATIDSSCGNCEDPSVPVPCTVGLHLRGRFIHLRGPEDNSVVVETRAGYGLFVDQCASAVIENLTITGGERDTSGMATDAAIVVKNSRAVIRGNRIMDNIGDSSRVVSHVVGIMGICGREHADLVVENNRITRNSWDGIALYRDASAVIEGNLIDGVDKARGAAVGGGRGVAIGLTWNARAVIRGNLVKRYWKGIGVFVDAHAVVENNIVEDIITWGISLWDADKGAPTGFIRRNIVYRTGACGASITRSVEGALPGEFVDNVIVHTAQDPKYDAPDYYCYQCALAVHAIPAYFRIERNLFHDNRRSTSDLPDQDLPREAFFDRIASLCHSVSEHPLFKDSDFATDFCSGK
jgi:parallel beta-helix repeat protein